MTGVRAHVRDGEPLCEECRAEQARFREAMHQGGPAGKPLELGRLDRAPARHALERIPLVFARVQGGWDVTSPWVPEMRLRVTTMAEHARAPLLFATEVEIKAHSRWKGQRPDIEALGTVDVDSFDEPLNRSGLVAAPVLPPKTRGGANRAWAKGGKREQNPADYQMNSDGSVTSPAGKRVKAEGFVRAIVRRRLSAGLSILPTDAVFDLSAVDGLGEQITRGAMRDGTTPHDFISAAVFAFGKPSKKRPDDRKPGPGQLALVGMGEIGGAVA